MEKIKDITFELNTTTEGFDEYTSPHINGKIESIIIDVPYGSIDLGLYFEDMYDICLIEKYQIVGQQYIPIRIDTIGDDAMKFNFTQDKWSINNKLYCLIEGGLNIKATITIRYSGS